MDLRGLLKRLRTRGPSGEKVELKPLEQVALALLLRQDGAPASAVQAAIDERRPVLPQPAAEVMTALLEQGLAEARYRPETGDSVFVATARGGRLRGRIPENPSTVTDYWL